MRRAMDIDGVMSAFPQQLAAMGLQMTNQVTPLQAGVILKRSRMTGRLPNAAWASVRFPSSTSRTASSRDRKSRRVGKECRSRWSPYH